jgi:hypothetical protein
MLFPAIIGQYTELLCDCPGGRVGSARLHNDNILQIFT